MGRILFVRGGQKRGGDDGFVWTLVGDCDSQHRSRTVENLNQIDLSSNYSAISLTERTLFVRGGQKRGADDGFVWTVIGDCDSPSRTMKNLNQLVQT
ncbi:hypothetical protein OESDEN_16642 [Oesophagostomum dentatum]|uniref:Uncharacterized protein n=1 Tax=Oesophagostomum dentatum TaxID=61180 RepID=A0A0B1SJJ5_OESDE|nr:hypothetical protein OESDEN_16642 [Oesophagostomum dentatum]